MVTSKLSDTARTWVYQSTRKFTMAEAIQLRQEIGRFISGWTSHREGVAGEGDLLYNRFIILMADEEIVKVGGCSIDSSVHFIRSLEDRYGTRFFDRWNIAFKAGEEVQSCTREEFSKLIESGDVHDETIVFNNLVQTKHELINKWQIPYRESWLKDVASTNTPFNSIL